MTSQQFLELLTSPRSIVITEKMARRRGYALGGEIRLMAGDRVNTYVIRGLLKDEGPARVMDGSFVLMDIAAAQLAFDRLGRVDRVDVQLTGAGGVAPTTADIDASLAAIASRLPAGLTAQRPGRRGEQVERMLAAFHLNLTALSWVALVVGLFLIYNTVTISVIARRDEIGVLRALGVTRRQVLALFLSEAAVLGLAGTVLGIGIGRVMADAAVGLTSPPSARSTSPPRRRRRRWRRGTSRWRSPSACRYRCSRRCCRRAKPVRCRPRPRCAAPIDSNRACACGQAPWSFPRWCSLEPSGWRSSGPSMAARSSAMPRRSR